MLTKACGDKTCHVLPECIATKCVIVVTYNIRYNYHSMTQTDAIETVLMYLQKPCNHFNWLLLSSSHIQVVI